MKHFGILCLAAAMAACATPASDTADVDPLVEAASAENPTNYDLAMGTVASLVEAGNEQIAIDRLTQMLGDPGMNEAQMAETLFRRAELRYGRGNDLTGAVEDLREIVNNHGATSVAGDARALLDDAETEYTMLSDMLKNGSISPMERFEILFRLGSHQEAADLMLAGALEPENSYLLDMYQIGYLCDGDELAGPVYQIAEPDGTTRSVQFCELGK